MALTELQLIALLRLALTGEQEAVLSEYIDWEAIREMAEQQSVLGITFAGIERLPRQMMPAMPILMDWVGQAEKIKTQNETADKTSAKVVNTFERKYGTKAILLKGQSYNALYTDEKRGIDLRGLRTSGDIDLWAVKPDEDGGFSRGVLDRSRDYTLRLALQKRPDATAQPHHVDYLAKNGIPVELHFTPSTVFNLYYNRRVQRFFEDALPRCTDRLPIDVDVLFSLMHLRRHLIAEGVGLRQVIDLYFLKQRLAQTLTTNAERKAFEKNIDKLGLRTFADAMDGVLAIMGLLEPKGKDIDAARFVLAEIMKGGNFGHHNEDFKAPSGSKIGNLIAYTRHALRCVRYFPSESIWNPIYRIYVGVWRKTTTTSPKGELTEQTSRNA